MELKRDDLPGLENQPVTETHNIKNDSSSISHPEIPAQHSAVMQSEEAHLVIYLNLQC